MLNKEVNIVHTNAANWLFTRYSNFLTQRKYGQGSVTGIQTRSFLLRMALIKATVRANMRRNPESTAIMPHGICSDVFDRVISDIKNLIRP